MGHSAHVPPGPSSGSSVIHELPAEGAPPDASAPELGGLFHKVRRNWQDYGWNITARKSFAYLVRAVYFRQVYRIYRIKLADAAPPSQSNVYSFKFKMLTPHDA